MQYTLDVAENISDYLSEYYEELDVYMKISNQLAHDSLEIVMENVILDASSFEILNPILLQNPNGIINTFSQKLDKSNGFIDIALFLTKARLIFTKVCYAKFKFTDDKNIFVREYCDKENTIPLKSNILIAPTVRIFIM